MNPRQFAIGCYKSGMSFEDFRQALHDNYEYTTIISQGFFFDPVGNLWKTAENSIKSELNNLFYDEVA